ncbi:MAG: cupin domain-containing protein [Nitrososphaeraceae archaeon]
MIIEPHTHSNAAELNYVINGKVHCTVFSPNGEAETSEIGQGHVFFVSSGYFHYLEEEQTGEASEATINEVF